jgi:hypothetical protein
MRRRASRFAYAAAAVPPIVALVAALVTLVPSRVAAHKPITSPYNYNNDVFPLLRDHCAPCHVPGGAAPMSLMTYAEAVPWAESIRDEMASGRMPPWPVDPRSPAVVGPHPISAKDIDKIVTWATGGTPPGDTAALAPVGALQPKWTLGPPDLALPMDAAHTVVAGALDELCDFSLPTGLGGTRWVKAIDLLPGSASIVRDAVLGVEGGQILGLWQPGDNAIAAPEGMAFKLPAGARIHLQIHYRKHFDQEQQAVTDRSTIGLYFAAAPATARPIQSFTIDALPAAGTGTRVFSDAVPAGGRIVAVRPMLDAPYDAMTLDVVTPGGEPVPILNLRGPRPQWFRRYWLQTPIDVAAGSRIEARMTPMPADADEPKAQARFPLHVVLDYVLR